MTAVLGTAPAPAAAKFESRNDGLDTLKGLLIIMVVAGHVPEARVGESAFKFAIYSVHMPLFLAVSGYLLSERSLRRQSLFSLLHKHLHRMWIPWGLAFVVFSCWEHRRHLASPRRIASYLGEDLLYPFHHLWYIPAVGLMIYGLWCVLRCRVPRKALLAGALSVTLAGMMMVGGIGGDVVHAGGYAEWMGDKRLVLWFGFFVLGFWLRNGGRLPLSTEWVGSIAMALYVAHFATFWSGPGAVSGFLFVVLNMCLSVAALLWFSRRPELSVRGVTWMGRESLAIYLWHPLVLLPLGAYFKQHGTPLMHAVTATALLVCVFLPAIFLLGQVPLLKQWCFGAVPSIRPRGVVGNAAVLPNSMS